MEIAARVRTLWGLSYASLFEYVEDLRFMTWTSVLFI